MCRLAGCKGNVTTSFNPKLVQQVINNYSQETSRMVFIQGMVNQVCDVCRSSNPDREVSAAVVKWVKSNPEAKGRINLVDIAEDAGIDLPKAMLEGKDLKRSKFKEKPVLPSKVSGGKPAELPSSVAKDFEHIKEGADFVHAIDGGGKNG